MDFTPDVLGRVLEQQLEDAKIQRKFSVEGVGVEYLQVNPIDIL